MATDEKPKRAIRRITLLMPDGEALVYFEKGKGKRKSSKPLKRLERAQRKLMEAVVVGAEDYLDRHDKSSRKKKDGWAREYAYNSQRANEKMMKKIRKITLF